MSYKINHKFSRNPDIDGVPGLFKILMTAKQEGDNKVQERNEGESNDGYIEGSESEEQKDSHDFVEEPTAVVTTGITDESTTEAERAEWGGGLEFLMACISSSVGLGNVWRFPYTAYQNGGGVFLIPYVIVLILVGKPFYYLEGTLGQFTGRSCGRTLAMCPALKGVGYGQILIGFYVVTYYCSLMALTIYYLISSFANELPWSYCRDEWTNCVDAKTTVNQSILTDGSLSSSAEMYFRNIVLHEVDTIADGLGLPSWKLFLCLMFSWIVLFGILCRGVKSTGKAAYFLAIFPYVIMIALLVRAVTLEGAVNGILFFVTPQWNKLWEPTVWYAAITQCFFSLSVCFGPVLTYSSHNNFRHQVDRDVMIVTTLDTFTSFMAGCTIFGILGNLAHEMGTDDISNVVRGGTGLAFISYPDALSRFTFVPQLFAVMFFFMMFVLGAGSAMALCAGVLNVFAEHFPKIKQWKLVAIFCVIGCLFGLIYITPGGQWFVTLIDYYGGTFMALIIGVLEIVTVFWIYGLNNFLNDVEFMLGTRPGIYWRVCWSFITPVLMIIVFIYTIIVYESPTYDGMEFPVYANVIGWGTVVLGLLIIICWSIIKMRNHRKSSLLKTIANAFVPSEKWGPRDEKTKAEWKEFIMTKKSKYKRSFKELYFG